MMDRFRLDGRVALVTGASGGLGAHFAATLAAAGATVGLAARRRDVLETVAAGIGDAAIPIEMDVTDPASVVAGLKTLEDAAGKPAGIIVNNAGIAGGSRFLEADRGVTEAVFATNQMAAFDVSQQAARRLVAVGEPGSIINIGSIAGLRPLGGAAAYSSSKAAVIHLTRVQALELARHNIRVNAIAPGYVETDINRDFLHSEEGQALVRRLPMRRTGQKDELDGVLLLLASDAGSFITGSVMAVDGGHLCTSL